MACKKEDKALIKRTGQHKELQYGLCAKEVLIGLKCDSVQLNITEAAIEVDQKDDKNEFQVMPRKSFAVNAIGYFQAVG